MKPSSEQRAARVELLVMDVDGVLTGGQIIYPGLHGELKIFDVRDGHGLALAKRAGLQLAIITGRTSEAVQRRARELGVDVVMEGQSRKGAALVELMGKLRVKPERVCYVGDDLMDLPALLQAGFPVAVSDAVEEVKDAASWVTTKPGGQGAVRETVEYVLKAKGLWTSLVQSYRTEA